MTDYKSKIQSEKKEVVFESKKRYVNHPKEKFYAMSQEKKILYFFEDKPTIFRWQKEKDIYYNKDVGYVSLDKNFYPKSFFRSLVMENLFLSKTMSKYATIFTLAEFLSLYEKQRGLITNRLNIKEDAKFILEFYSNPGNYWTEFVVKKDYNLLITLHTIALDTTLFRINGGLKPNEIKESLYCCVLHVLLLEQLLPPVVMEKQFLIEIRQRLFIAIQYGIKQEKLFFNVDQFFKMCMRYYQENHKKLALREENLYAIDFRFQRYSAEIKTKL